MLDYRLNSREPIVLGVGSRPVGRAAAMWAADEAEVQNRPLRLVSGVDPGEDEPLGGHRSRAARLKALDEARAFAMARRPGLDIAERLVEGPTQRVLVDSVKDAAMLVVGARSITQMGDDWRSRGLVDGLAAQASCPVAVVRTGALPLELGEQRIVVGVGGDSSCDGALRYAFEEASRRGAGVTAVLVAPAPEPDTAPSRDDLGCWAAEMRRRMGSWRADHPLVDTRLEVMTGPPAWTLSEAAADALCLVIGADRAPGEVSSGGRVHGSVEHVLMRCAVCPIVAVPA